MRPISSARQLQTTRKDYTQGLHARKPHVTGNPCVTRKLCVKGRARTPVRSFLQGDVALTASFCDCIWPNGLPKTDKPGERSLEREAHKPREGSSQ